MHKKSQSASGLFESLENRNLFAYSFSQSGGAVTATNLISTSNVSVSESGGVVSITVAGDGSSPHAFSGVTSLTINGGGGTDAIALDSSVSSAIAVSINGNAGSDTLRGGNGSDTIVGGDGADFIYGEGGNDSLYGGTGNDVIEGGAGNDMIFGGDDNDTIRGDAGSDVLRGENGTDTVDYSTETSGIMMTLDNVANDGASGENDNVANTNEVIIGSGYNDSIDASYVAYSTTILGGNGNDIISGGSATDSLNGGSGTDTLIASAGGDMTSGFEVFQ